MFKLIRSFIPSSLKTFFERNDPKRLEEWRDAARQGDINTVENLIKQGMMKDVNEDYVLQGLFIASQEGHKDIAGLLINNNCPVNGVGEHQKTAIFLAVEGNKKDMVEFLIDHGASLNHQDQNSHNVLMLAARLGFQEMVDLLIQKGCPVDYRDVEGKSALMHAIIVGNCEIAILLLNRGSKVNATDLKGTSCLHYAVMHRRTDIIPILFQFKAYKDATDKQNSNALMHAISMGEVEIVRMLLEYKCSVEAVKRHKLWIALHQAAWEADEDITKLLLEFGSDPNSTNSEGITAIISAIQGAKHKSVLDAVIRVIGVLAGYGCNVNAGDKRFGDSAIMYAARFGFHEVIEALVHLGADPNYLNKNNETPVITCIKHYYGSKKALYLQSIETLAKSGAILDYCAGGQTPLLYATRLARDECVNKLLSLGANPHITDENQVNALIVATQIIPRNRLVRGHYQRILTYLLKTGVNVNHQDAAGNTAIIFAVKNEQDRYIKVLLNNGANPYITNKEGISALQICEAVKDSYIKEQFRYFQEIRREVYEGAAVSDTVDGNPSNLYQNNSPIESTDDNTSTDAAKPINLLPNSPSLASTDDNKSTDVANSVNLLPNNPPVTSTDSNKSTGETDATKGASNDRMIDPAITPAVSDDQKETSLEVEAQKRGQETHQNEQRRSKRLRLK
ncbi:Ankyrin repeat domain-containing protein 50 [Trichoplax sp. H2]|nr:Ankyrin repeat domain-containing protein 50 [Trichoplax sp. H2]|eukprot:RDD44054.1 Ankyrin repeat domain-containing protein 50 [Trichoplax sp. H2]